MNNLSRSGHFPVTVEGHAALDLFQLAPDRIHLNHGGYGAVPKTVSAAQNGFRALIESDPTSFFADVLPGEMRRLAGLVAQRFGGAAGDWVFCENATSAINSVLSSLSLRDGDEILTTSHGYGAVLKAMHVCATRHHAKLVVAEIPAIVESEDQIVDIIARAFNRKTKLLVVDHITSPTAIVFPVAKIAQAARAAGVAILVDGAHAPGQVPVDVDAIGADWYTGNAHKWLFAPKACGVLWTAPHRQAQTLPAILSHGTSDGYLAAFDWIGTRDVTPWLCFENAAKQHDTLGGINLMDRNRALAAQAADLLSQSLAKPLSAPPAMRAAMASICLGAATSALDQNVLRRSIFRETGAVTAIFVFGGSVWLRISAQIYNAMEDYRALLRGLPAIVAELALP